MPNGRCMGRGLGEEESKPRWRKHAHAAARAQGAAHPCLARQRRRTLLQPSGNLGGGVEHDGGSKHGHLARGDDVVARGGICDLRKEA